MKSLAKPRYTQEQYEQASAVYMYSVSYTHLTLPTIA